MKKLLALIGGIFLICKLSELDPVANGIVKRIKTIIFFENPIVNFIKDKMKYGVEDLYE